MSVSVRARALVLAVALAASANSLRNGFVYDDIPIVVEDARIHDLARWREIAVQRYWPTAFGDDQLYRPLTTLSFAADWAIGGGRPLPFHLVNLFLHLAATALVLLLAARLLPPAGAVVAGLWFAVQPVHTEAVASVVGRGELLAAVGYLLAALLVLRALQDRVAGPQRWLHTLGVFGAALVSVAAKEHGLTLAAALLLITAAVQTGEPWRARFQRAAPLLGAALLAAALFLMARERAIGVDFGHGQIAAGLEHKNALERFVSMLPGYFTWARLLLVPVDLSADYAPDAIRPLVALTAGHIAGLAAVLGAAALAVWARRRAPAVTLGIAWFVVTASVAANVVVPTGVLLAERTLYLPSAGIAVAIGGLWSLVPPHRVLWPATAAALALLAARTIERNTLWRENTAFFARLATDAPDSYRTHWMRGTWEFRAGRFAAGERLYRQALAIYPFDGNLLAELGMWYLDARLFDPADRYLTLALRVDSSLGEAAAKAVFARLEAGRVDSAVTLARVAARRFPGDASVLLIAVHALQRGGDSAGAAALGPALIAIDSTRWQFHQVAADAAARAGRCAEGRAWVRRAAALAPPAESGPRLLLAQIDSTGPCALR